MQGPKAAYDLVWVWVSLKGFVMGVFITRTGFWDMSYYIPLCYVMLYCVMLCYALLYCTVLFSILLCL